MEIVLDKISNTEALIKVSLKQDDYQPKVEEKIKEYSKKANIKGFRQGKVPRSLINKMYGKSILVDEVNHMLSHKVMDYIKENDIQILGEPLPNVEKAAEIDWDSQSEFDFEYSIGMANDFEVKLDNKVKIENFKIKVDDKVINETIDNLRKQFGTMTNPETSEEGDILYGELVTDDEDENKTAELDLTQVDKKQLKNFIGKKKDDTIEFDTAKTLKDESYRESFSGSKDSANIKFLVKNINRKVSAEVNQDLFDKTFGKDAVKSEEEFKKKIKEVVGKNYDQESENYLNYKIQDEFVEKTKMELPDNFLKRFIEISNKETISKEDIEKDYEHYANDLKWSLIKNKISKDNEIKIAHEDVILEAKNMIRQQFAASGFPADQLEGSLDSFVDNYLKGEDGNNYMKLHEKVYNDKVLEFIKSSITIKDKEVTPEEFNKKS
ncbi:trigger factor [Reichenbachiella sp. MALMAid0571]|uniref:trigger factor n=1 Tax=Reichenbachiella sp. MALMAid0571 TaxID=3143939 RepID=UPI0032DEB589